MCLWTSSSDGADGPPNSVNPVPRSVRSAADLDLSFLEAEDAFLLLRGEWKKPLDFFLSELDGVLDCFPDEDGLRKSENIAAVGVTDFGFGLDPLFNEAAGEANGSEKSAGLPPHGLDKLDETIRFFPFD